MTAPQARQTQTLDQERASHAWNVIERLPREKEKAVGTQAKKLPTRIMTSGLGQALAFLEAKDASKKNLAPLLDALNDWMNRRRPVPEGQTRRLLVRLIQGDSDFQRFATAECLAYLIWLVRFADARGITEDEQQD